MAVAADVQAYSVLFALFMFITSYCALLDTRISLDTIYAVVTPEVCEDNDINDSALNLNGASL